MPQWAGLPFIGPRYTVHREANLVGFCAVLGTRLVAAGMTSKNGGTVRNYVEICELHGQTSQKNVFFKVGVYICFVEKPFPEKYLYIYPDGFT